MGGPPGGRLSASPVPAGSGAPELRFPDRRSTRSAARPPALPSPRRSQEEGARLSHAGRRHPRRPRWPPGDPGRPPPARLFLPPAPVQ
ncbi:MAG: hypothetical protein DMH00_07215 [Acidobacteria bacterium]|nr:MAG: hypothetical protein DMH00_07215 [Acidobacteriota bacterium]